MEGQDRHDPGRRQHPGVVGHALGCEERLGEHVDRHVPQVHRVRDVPDVHQRTVLEDRERPPRLVHAACDHGRGHQHRYAGPGSREGHSVVEQEDRGEQPEDPEPSQQRTGKWGDPSQLRTRCREHAADRELPHPVERRVVGLDGCISGVAQRVGEGHHGDHGHHGEHDRLTPDAQAPGQHERPQEQQRPHRVELFLERERPVVQQRRLGPGREVVGALDGEVPVGGQQQRPETVVGHQLAASRRVEQVRRDHRDDDDDDSRRHQPPEPAQVEGDEVDPAPLVEDVDQDPGDQETGQHEEDVECREHSLRLAEEVPEDHEQDADAAHALQVQPHLLAARLARRDRRTHPKNPPINPADAWARSPKCTHLGRTRLKSR